MTREGATVGETIQVRFSELKAVFQVKSFDGHFDARQRYPEYHPEGGERICEFADGEFIRGFTLHPYEPDEQRFFLIPTDSSSNNISILVERSALKHVYTPEEYEQHRLKEIEERGKEDATGDVTHEESMGDFYFETRNYPAALQQYTRRRKPSLVRRLRRKSWPPTTISPSSSLSAVITKRRWLACRRYSRLTPRTRTHARKWRSCVGSSRKRSSNNHRSNATAPTMKVFPLKDE